MAYTERTGLLAYPSTGDIAGEDDLRQGIFHGAAISEVVATLLGGEGIYSGGATVLGDITTGTDYPAFVAMVKDDSDVYWMLRKASATAMTFLVTSGACTAYLVVSQVSGVSPAMATGGVTDFQIIVQLTATAAPAHSVALGAGTVAASAFTDWTPASVFVAANAGLFQRYDAELAAIAGLASAANKVIRFTGSGAAELIDMIGETDYSSTSTVTGWSNFTGGSYVKSIFYSKHGSRVSVTFLLYGDSDATTASFTLPYAATRATWAQPSQIVDNSVTLTASGAIQISGSTCTLRKTMSSSTWAWTNTGAKLVYGEFFYHTAS